MKKIISILSISMLLLIISVGATAAQDDCPPGLEGDDCALFTNAVATTTAGATSFALTFDNTTSIQLGDLLTLDISAAGEGAFLMADGLITTADVVMPSAETGFGGMMGGFLGESTTGAASFTLVDGMLYFGSGETVDERTFSSITLAEYPDTEADLSFGGMGGSFAVDLADAEWTTSSADGATVFTAETSFDLSDPAFLDTLVTGEAAGLVSGLAGEGLQGTITINNSVSVDPTTGFLLAVNTSTIVTFDMEALIAEMGDDAEMFGDMLSGDGGVTITLNAAFSDYNGSFEITAPDEAEAMDTFTAESALTAASDGIPALISSYFSTLATGSDAGLGGGGGGFVDNTYYGNCTTDQRTYIEGGSISLGETVSGDLAESEAATWTFSGTAGEVVSIAMNSGPLDTYLELLGPDGAGVAGNDDFSGLNSRIDGFALPTDGEYTIVACTYDGFDAGGYDLSLETGASAGGEG